jgi:hypothetical protein
MGVATPLWRNVKMTRTLPKWGLRSPPRLPKIQSSIIEVPTLRLDVFFMPLERSWSVDVENGLAWATRTFTTQVMDKRRAKFDSWPLKVENRPNPDVCKWSATHCWKALKVSYKFAWDFIPIKGLSKKLWIPKVTRIQIGIVSGFLLGSLGKKCHSDVGGME